jgi:hypothetical protein
MKMSHIRRELVPSDRRAYQDQGDQIGRIFAQWTTFYFGEIYQNYMYI